MVLKISSKFELRRFCRTTGSVAMVSVVLLWLHYIETFVTLCLIHFIFLQQLKLCQPKPDDLGYVDSVSVEEIGGARVS
jgi:T-complex protein 1 subunit theta